jgi:hypothetical protein
MNTTGFTYFFAISWLKEYCTRARKILNGGLDFFAKLFLSDKGVVPMVIELKDWHVGRTNELLRLLADQHDNRLYY